MIARKSERVRSLLSKLRPQIWYFSRCHMRKYSNVLQGNTLKQKVFSQALAFYYFNFVKRERQIAEKYESGQFVTSSRSRDFVLRNVSRPKVTKSSKKSESALDSKIMQK